MSLVDLDVAKGHLRLDADYPDAQVQQPLAAAEGVAARYIGRRIFADPAALAAAIAAAPAQLVAANAARQAAQQGAAAVTDDAARRMVMDSAEDAYAEAVAYARQTYVGVVIDDQLCAGILLILGHLFENRSDVEVGVSVEKVPMASRDVLQPYRVGMGV